MTFPSNPGPTRPQPPSTPMAPTPTDGLPDRCFVPGCKNGAVDAGLCPRHLALVPVDWLDKLRAGRSTWMARAADLALVNDLVTETDS